MCEEAEMENNLTQKEKAERLDALQAAIEHTLKVYRDREKSLMEFYYRSPSSTEGIINYGGSVAYRNVIEDLERWTI